MRYLCVRCTGEFGDGKAEGGAPWRLCPHCAEDEIRKQNGERPMDDVVWEWWEGEQRLEEQAAIAGDLHPYGPDQ